MLLLIGGLASGQEASRTSAPGRGAADEAWPSLDYLRSSLRASSVAAHVRVKGAVVVKRVGGYEEWRVAGEVGELFKGSPQPGQAIEYYHLVERGLRENSFTGEKIVFLLRRYYEPEKSWVYAALENSTLPYTKEAAEKLRQIQRSAQGQENPRRTGISDSFEKTYMAKVGRKITVQGVVESAKIGPVVIFDHGRVYIYSLGESDGSKMKAVAALKGQIVEVRGTLRYAAGSSAAGEGELSIPAHFFFDAAEARVIGVRPLPR